MKISAKFRNLQHSHRRFVPQWKFASKDGENYGTVENATEEKEDMKGGV